MNKKIFLETVVVCAVLALRLASSHGDPPPQGSIVGRGGQVAGPELPVAVALDPHAEFERLVVGADGTARQAPADEGSVAGAGERLIYSNTLGINTVNFPSNGPVSDDIATTAPNDCALKRYRFKVLGKVLPTGLSGAYTVTYGLYTQCPLASGSTNAMRDLVRIPGTEGVLTFPDDAPRLIEHVVSAQTPVALPTNFYLSLRFNRANCGTVLGAPATIGYSGDIFDFPGFPCNGWFGGFPQQPHASFWAEFFGGDTCPEAYVAYKANRQSGGAAYIGANTQGVDDVRLMVNNCQMIGYEVTVKGTGYYTFDLRRTCDGQVIPGTERIFLLYASMPQLQAPRFNFDPPISLNSADVFLGFSVTSNSAGSIIAGIKPNIGESDNDYFTQSPATGCSPVPPTQGVYGAINLAITCAGTQPTGACCDHFSGTCAEEVGGTSCSETYQVWSEGAACTDIICESIKGACCDTNGADQGCTDNVTLTTCTGPDKVWTENGQCADQECHCIADCTGKNCGEDGCGGQCPAIPCHDSNVCTDDSCNPANGQCVFTNNTASCSDGNACNGVEVCMGGQCVPGTPLVCNDGNACNGIESCSPQTGCVQGIPLQCNDGVACNGVETCNPQSGCVAGTPVNCDDGLDCTADACNEPTGTCTHDAADCAIPTVSDWGLVVVTLLLLTCAKIVFSGNRKSRLI